MVRPCVLRFCIKPGVSKNSCREKGAKRDDDGGILSHGEMLVYTNFQYSICIQRRVNLFMITTTHTQEDYLRAIYLLSTDGDGTVTISELAEKLGLRKPTVTQRVENLEKKKWVTRKRYGPVRLTATGRTLAENLTYKHRVIELFLCEVLKMKKTDVHAEAHRLEHAVSDAVIVRMAKYLKNPTHGPHGEALPEFRPNGAFMSDT